ncbi:MAG: hypothetical protein ABL949_00625, partial [Fimbriimonadaceae bacterium]
MKLLLASLLTACTLPFALGQPGTTTRVSVSTAGVESNGFNWTPALSGDGRYVAFASSASNLVANDTNGSSDIFVRDRQTGQTIRVSVSSAGLQANGGCVFPSFSSNGRYVGFTSTASNLVTGDTNGREDAFVYDLLTGETLRVSIATGGAQANRDCGSLQISDDGRFTTFVSSATNLVANDTNGEIDAFVHDSVTGETTRVSVASTGAQAVGGFASDPKISADGRFVCFQSSFPNLVLNDTNGGWDVFVHDRQTGQTSRASVSSMGAQANGFCFEPGISGDGRYIVFSASASNLVVGDANGTADVFVHDRLTGTTRLASLTSQGRQVNRESRRPEISHDGRLVMFESSADNYVAGDTNRGEDCFVTDQLTGDVR